MENQIILYSNAEGKITVNEKIETIDYGALALAEARKEKNALERKIYKDDFQ